MRKTLGHLKVDSLVRKAETRRTNWKAYRGMVISLLRERDGDDCGICGEEMAYDDMSIDHILGVWQGGSDEADNLQLAHLTCNLTKPRGSFTTKPTSDVCARGHDLTDPKNVYERPNGERNCRPCIRDKENTRRKVARG